MPLRQFLKRFSDWIKLQPLDICFKSGHRQPFSISASRQRTVPFDFTQECAGTIWVLVECPSTTVKLIGCYAKRLTFPCLQKGDELFLRFVSGDHLFRLLAHDIEIRNARQIH